MKEKIAQALDSMEEQLIDLAKKIFDLAELSYEEKESSRLLANFLQENGFSVTRNVAGLSTAFLAETGKGRPKIALLAEYDALPEIGHACGHNMIGVMSCGAAVAVKKALQDLQFTVVGGMLPRGGKGSGEKIS
jgi:Metal-dependent amidase/aminoacylase/carboxypeptidase